MKFPSIEAGKRCILVGRTGNGKTTLAYKLMLNSPLHWIVLDCKNDERFDKFRSYDIVDKLRFEGKFTVVRPSPHFLSDRKALDAWIFALSETYEQVGLFVDELMYVTLNSAAGAGLTGWLTRGRSRKQSFLGCTQRPARVSMFVFSEADYLINLGVTHKDDQQRLSDITGNREFSTKPPRFHWHYYNVADDSVTKFAPVNPQ